jgi:hypothetical protein
MKQMLIITGPQGSGNHVFSKVLALHKDVSGWKELLNDYWIAHDYEPFSECWNTPSLVHGIDWSSCDNYVTSISCPYASNGVVTIPKYEEFIEALEKFNIKVKVAIIGRDQNILKYQQQRVRDRVSLQDFDESLGYLMTLDPVFVSQELLYLYKSKYLQSLSKQLDFPIAYNDPRVNKILEEDANSKYFRSIERQDLDNLVRKVSGIKDTI